MSAWTNDDELDLKWYYLCSAAACGMRSTLGGQLDAIEASAFAPGTPKTTVWMAKPKRTMCQRDVNEDRIIDAATREREINFRLVQLPDELQTILWLQYGDALIADKDTKISLSLASATQAAADSHEKALSRARRKNKQAEASVRAWIRWLIGCPREEARGMLQPIVDEAASDLARAKTAYASTVRKTIASGRR